EMWATMQQVFAPVQKLAPETMPFSLRLVEALPWEPSDSSAFMAADVPGFFWDQAGRSDYDRYHHTQHDHADAVIDEYQRHSALVVAIAAWNLAALDEPLERENALGLPSRKIGAVIDPQGVVEELVDDGVGAIAGLQIGDRIVEVDGTAVGDRAALIEAVQRGAPSKLVVVERIHFLHAASAAETSTSNTRVELRLDWTADPDEPARQRRRDQRRERFGPELRPWDVEHEETDHE